MENIPIELFQISPLAIIAIFAVREFFSYLKSRKNGPSVNYEKELASVNAKLDNHISTFSEDLREVRNDIRTIKEAIIDIKISIKK